MRKAMVLLTFVGLVLLLFAVALQAQAPAPKVGPEQKKLEIWVGNWIFEGEMKATPLGPAGKSTGEWTARFMLKGFFTNVQGEYTGPAGTTQWSEINSYNTVTKKYNWNGFDSGGGISIGTYTIEGTTVPYTGNQMVGGKEYKIRGNCVFSSDFMSMTEKREISVDGVTWMPLFEIKGTKAKSSPK